ncbi:MAG: YvcK family protein [Bryobacterales bacterium]|nr:YvcK family protein [Bryobacterales bacterium]
MKAQNAQAPLRIVSIGGGTGLSALLQGLKRYAPAVDITAVVTVTDDGGSSGRLRREFEVLPPGDIRNCLVALSEDEGLLAKLFQYRFSSGRGLKGHSFGNLFLTALADITGDFQHAVKLSSDVLAIAGKIYPSTAANVTLEARFEDGTSVRGESRISKSRVPIDSVRLRPGRCKPLKETLAAIANADLITLGPGSLFTSVVPNLLVGGVSKAIRNSSALKAYFCNLMWQPGETMQFRASDHVRAIHEHAGRKLVNTVVVNTGEIKPSLRKRYAREAARPVENDLDELKAMGLDVVAGDLVARSERVRHSPDAIAAMAIRLAFEGRGRKKAGK